VSGVDVSGDGEGAASLAQRRLANRRSVTWAHALLGSALVFIYISRITLTRYRYWQFGASEALIAITAPAWIPYLISALNSRRLVMTGDRSALWFIASITMVSALVAAVLLGAIGSPTGLGVLLLFGGQTIVFIRLAEILLRK